jgi:hypothetical protein
MNTPPAPMTLKNSAGYTICTRMENQYTVKGRRAKRDKKRKEKKKEKVHM